MSLDATNVQTETAAPVSEPTAGGSEPTASVEPSAEPTASEPAEVAAPEPAAHESFSWDDWDGSADALPEDARGWYSQFSTRFDEERVKMQAEAEKYRRWYESSMYGGSFPEREELATKVQQYEAKVSELTAAQEEMSKEYEAQAEADANDYFDLVNTMYADTMAKIQSNPEDVAVVSEALEHASLAKILDLYKTGDKDLISFFVDSVKKGMDEKAAWEVVSKAKDLRKPAQQAPAPAPTPKPAPRHSPAASVVTGASPAMTRPATPKPDLSSMNLRERSLYHAQQAIRENRR